MDLPCKSMFPRSREVAYLDTAAEGLLPSFAEEALATYYRDKSLGTSGRSRLYEEGHKCRKAAARMLGVNAEDVAFVASVSDGLNALANSIDWRPGDEVVTTDLEFPANVLAWLRLRHRGVRLRVVRSSRGTVTLDQFAAAIGPATRLVTTSQVSYKSGANFTYIPELAAEAHRAGAFFSLDVTQAAGRIPIPLAGVDYLVCSAYKWLLGIHGTALVYVAPEANARFAAPGVLGWYSVKDIFRPDRFETFECKEGAGYLEAGMPNFASLYALRRSLDLLNEAGVERLQSTLRPLVLSLRNCFAELGFDVLTPEDPTQQAGIVSFEHPEAERIGDALEQSGIVVWRGDGRVRASVHLYNDAPDVETLVAALASLAPANQVRR